MHRTIIQDYVNSVSGCGLYLEYHDISKREKWEALSADLKSKLIRAGEEAQAEPWTQLLISDFREFKKSGNRVRFEDKYFPRRRKLNSLVLAECVENKGRFLEDILDGLYLILEETTWCLPPHTSYIRDSEQEAMPDVTRPIIDLFDAESGAEVAFLEYLLRPVLRKMSPYISTYVNERLKERIFTPYLGEHFWWMGDGEQPMCNWTVWCTQNVLLCALTRPSDFFTEEERRVFLEKAAISCDYFLDEYGEDGCCNEGAQYYSHAGLCLFGCLEIMRGALSGKGADGIGSDTDSSANKTPFDGVFSEKLIRNVANYIVKMYVANGYYVNFADCSALPGNRTAREYLFGRATGDEALYSFAALDFQKETRQEKLIFDEINLFYHVMQTFAYDEMTAFDGKVLSPEDSFFESVGLMVSRDEHYVLAAKAGDNADSHNHNDVGSFTVYKDGTPFIIDLGVGTYTQKTFSNRRYEIWTMQSQFHNLPTFLRGGAADIESPEFILGDDPAKDAYNDAIIMQHDGEEYAADKVNCILCCNEGDNSADKEKCVSSLKMDIAGAYDNENIKSYGRTVSLIKGKGIVIEDAYDGNFGCVLSIMTYEKPEIVSGKKNDGKEDKMIIKVGNLGELFIEGAEKAVIQAYPITDERLSLAWKHEVYRILLNMDESKRFKIATFTDR